jgi:hypothetical protein
MLYHTHITLIADDMLLSKTSVPGRSPVFDLVPLDPPAGGELVPASQPDLTLARRYAEAEKAAGTRVGYQRDWDRFRAWAASLPPQVGQHAARLRSQC